MACDIQDLLDEASCIQCTIPPGMIIYAQLAAMCNITTNPDELQTNLLEVGVDGVNNANLVVDPDADAPFILTRHVADGAPVILRLQKEGTTGNVDGPPTSADNLGRLDFYAYDGTAFFAGAVIQHTANQTWTGAAHGARLTFNVVANGATATTEMLRLIATQVDARNGAVFAVAGTQVVSARNTGWTTFTGTANKNAGALDTGTATTAQVAQVVKSIMDALITHGLLGA